MLVRMRARLLLASLFALLQTVAMAQEGNEPDPKALLLRVRANVVDTVTRLPRYMCSLTIDRQQYMPDPNHATSCDGMAAQRGKGQFEPHLMETDRVRLDVAVGASNEI